MLRDGEEFWIAPRVHALPFARRVRQTLFGYLNIVALVVGRAVNVADVDGAGDRIEDKGAALIEARAAQIHELDGDGVKVRVISLDAAGDQDVLLLAVRAGVYHEPRAPGPVALVPPLVEDAVLGHPFRPLEAADPHPPGFLEPRRLLRRRDPLLGRERLRRGPHLGRRHGPQRLTAGRPEQSDDDQDAYEQHQRRCAEQRDLPPIVGPSSARVPPNKSTAPGRPRQGNGRRGCSATAGQRTLRFCVVPGLVDDPLVLEVLSGDVLVVLLLEVDGAVQGAHLVGVQAGGDLVEDLLGVRVLVQECLRDDRSRLVNRPDRLGVLYALQLGGGELAVGGVPDADVGLALGQRLVADAEVVDDLDLLEVELRVILLHVLVAVRAVLELRVRGEDELVGLRREVVERLYAQLVGLVGQHHDAVAVVERRRLEHLHRGVFAVLVEFGDLLVGLFIRLRVRLRRLLQDGHVGRARVLGVNVYGTVLQRLVHDLLGAEVQLFLDVVALVLEGLGVHLAEEYLLGELLRAHRDARATAAVAAAVAAACATAASAGRRDE